MTGHTRKIIESRARDGCLFVGSVFYPVNGSVMGREKGLGRIDREAETYGQNTFFRFSGKSIPTIIFRSFSGSAYLEVYPVLSDRASRVSFSGVRPKALLVCRSIFYK